MKDSMRKRRDQTTEQEIAGPLVDYLMAQKGATHVRVITYHDGDARHHNPWVLWFTPHHGHQIPSKMPL